MSFKKILKSKLLGYFLIPLFLFTAWFGLSIYYNSYGPPSVLTYQMNSKTDRIDLRIKPLYKGEKITGSFIARENQLGIISVRFTNFKNINNDILEFSIKKKGQNKWYYQNFYRVDQFQDHELFTFGFPRISDSKHKAYEFQLKSTMGEKGDAIAISPESPVLVTKYQFLKSELLSNRNLLFTHLYKKFLNTFDSWDFFISSIVYMLPFITYVFWLFPVRPGFNYLSKRYSSLRFLKEINAGVVFIMVVIAMSSLLARSLSSQVATLILLGFWIATLKYYRLDSSVNFVFALFLVLASPILLILNLRDQADNAILWVYYLLLIGIFHQIAIWKFKPKKLVSKRFLLKND